MKGMKMKQYFVVLILLVFSGCTSYSPSTIKVLNNQKIQSITSWNIVYDSSSGLSETNSMIDNEKSFTTYQDVGDPENTPSPIYKWSELRGRKISDIIYKNLYDRGVKINENASGSIIINRPTFLDEGRYILHTYVSIFDKDKNLIAGLDIYNNCRQQNSTKGLHFVQSGDIMDDNGFAVLCADKIYNILNQ